MVDGLYGVLCKRTSLAVDFDYKVYTLFESIRIKNIDSVELIPTNALLNFPSEFVEVTMASS